VTVEAAGRIYGTMTTPQRVVVPDLIGMNRTSLTDTLRPLGLTAVSSTATSTTVPKGDVIAQDPEAGMHVRVGTVVHVVISRGP
jgi:serine/threonine-protein kinase